MLELRFRSFFKQCSGTRAPKIPAYAAHELPQHAAGLRLGQALQLHDVVEELAAARELHDQVQLPRRLQDLMGEEAR